MLIEDTLPATLTQLRQVLSELSNDDYKRALPILSNASIGQHTRHIIEFFQTLIVSYECGVVNYDRRKRNYLLETNLKAATEALIIIQGQIPADDKEMELSGSYSNYQSGEVVVKTTYYRELVYNLEHAIHHMAMIRIGIRESTALDVPADFGVAAATIKHRKSFA